MYANQSEMLHSYMVYIKTIDILFFFAFSFVWCLPTWRHYENKNSHITEKINTCFIGEVVMTLQNRICEMRTLKRISHTHTHMVWLVVAVSCKHSAFFAFLCLNKFLNSTFYLQQNPKSVSRIGFELRVGRYMLIYFWYYNFNVDVFIRAIIQLSLKVSPMINFGVGISVGICVLWSTKQKESDTHLQTLLHFSFFFLWRDVVVIHEHWTLSK